MLVADRHDERVDAVRLAARAQLRENGGDPPVDGGVADVVLARGERRRMQVELARLRIVRGGGLDVAHVRAVADLGHGEAARQIDGRGRGKVFLVMVVGAEPQDAAAPEAKLHAELDDQRDVVKPERLERRHEAREIVAAADGFRQVQEADALPRDLARPLEHLRAQPCRVRAAVVAERRLREDRAHAVL